MNNWPIPMEVAGFPIAADVVLRKRFTHMDVSVLVSNHSRQEDGIRGEEGTYCYYVYVWEDMLPAGVFDAEFWLPPVVSELGGRKRTTHNYMTAPFAEAGWNYGITFYEKLGGIDGEPRGVKLGCDYAHAWDSHFYRLDDVVSDAKRTVDRLRAMYPFLRRCSWNGSWAPEGEMVAEGARLYSKDGHAQWAAYRAERESAGGEA